MLHPVRIIFTVVILLGYFNALIAQENLVPNPSFELYDTCPDQGEIYFATGWMSFTGSPDYFNSCANQAIGYSVPNTGAGYQIAKDGNGFVGIALCIPAQAPNVREYVGIQLSQPLVVGTKYYVTFYANLANFVNCWSNKLGVKFTSYYYTGTDGDTTLIDNLAHIYSDSMLCDTSNWVKISGSFVADSSYEYFVIGNFFDDSNTDTLYCPSYSYAFIDQICISTDSSFCNANIGIDPSTEEWLYVYPNPSVDNVIVSYGNTHSYTVIISIYDIYGQLLKNVQHYSGASVDLSEFKSGIYFLSIKINNNYVTKRIIINH